MIPIFFNGTWILKIMMRTVNKERNRVINFQNIVYEFITK